MAVRRNVKDNNNTKCASDVKKYQQEHTKERFCNNNNNKRLKEDRMIIKDGYNEGKNVANDKKKTVGSKDKENCNTENIRKCS